MPFLLFVCDGTIPLKPRRELCFRYLVPGVFSFCVAWPLMGGLEGVRRFGFFVLVAEAFAVFW